MRTADRHRSNDHRHGLRAAANSKFVWAQLLILVTYFVTILTTTNTHPLTAVMYSTAMVALVAMTAGIAYNREIDRRQAARRRGI